MTGLASKLKNIACSAVVAGTMAVGGSALAAPVRLFPDYSAGGEISRKIIGNERVNGYAELSLDFDIVSYSGLSLGSGAKLMNFIRQTDTTTKVQPDVINYDIWGEICYVRDKIGKFGFSFYHQSMHNVDEENEVLVNDSRSHNILRLRYSNEFDVLEGLEMLVATGPYIQVHQSRYVFYFDAEAQLSLAKLWDAGELYVRSRKNPIIAEKGNGWWELNSEDEVGIEVIGEGFSMQFFLNYQHVEDYFMFESGTMDLLFTGLRVR